MEAKKKYRCIICDRPTDAYLWIRGHAICARCEKRIRNIRVMQRNYDFFVGRIHRLWEP